MKNTLASALPALLLSVGIANAVDPPPLKEGLWSVRTQITDNPGNRKRDSTANLCRNHAYDQHVRDISKRKPGCTTVNESFQAGQYTVEMHCSVSGTSIVAKGVTTFRGDTSAHSESRATFSPPTGGTSETIEILDQNYLGNCKAGTQPGDMISASGTVTHLWKH
jgi:hypothetical protein